MNGMKLGPAPNTIRRTRVIGTCLHRHTNDAEFVPSGELCYIVYLTHCWDLDRARRLPG